MAQPTKEHRSYTTSRDTITAIDRELAEQDCRQWIGLVTLRRLGQIGALDLRGAERDAADDSAGVRVAHHIRARGTALLIKRDGGTIG